MSQVAALIIFVCIRESTLASVGFGDFAQCHAIDFLALAREVARLVHTPQLPRGEARNKCGELI
jgi:hypothetical protein